MTIGIAGARVSVNCDGISKIFPVAIQAYLATDFTVILAAPVSAGSGQLTLTLNSDYSLAATGSQQPPQWTLTTLAANAYLAGYSLQVFVNPVQTQQTSYVQGQAFPSLALQTNLDRLTQMIQRLQDLITRTPHAPDGDVNPLMTLPSAAQRALTNLGFDANGNLSVNQVLASGILSQAAIVSFLYPQTGKEAAAGVTPISPYPAYDVRRYGPSVGGISTMGGGAVDDAPYFNLAGSIGVPIFVPDPPTAYLLNSNVTGTFESFNYPGFTGAGTISLRNLAASDQDNMEAVVAALEAGTATGIATFGDSTMWGADPANLNNQVAIPPYLQLQNFVNNYMGNTACTVTNFAISGTTLLQMLNGTDGSGLTFAARVAATAAKVVYCNHGVNDAFGPNQTSSTVYRAGLLAFIRIVRVAGKIPVLVTPHPCLTIGTFGSQVRAENSARFANIMRSVAQSHGVILIDNNWILSRILEVDYDINQINVNTPLNILADGVHGPQTTYLITGNNLADAIIGAQVPTLTRHGQRIGASSAAVRATNQSISQSTSSRMGGVQTTGTNAPQSMTIAFRIGETGLDLSIMHYIWSGGGGNIGVNLDGLGAGATTFPCGLANWSQLSAGYAASFLQDVETVICRNISVGLHLLTLTLTGTGAISMNAIAVRNNEKPVNLGSTAVTLEHRKLLMQKFEIPAGATNNVIGMSDIPCSRFIDTFEIEWTATMTKNSALAICANNGTNGGAPSPQQMLMFGLNASGFAQVWETNGPGSFTTGTFDAVDHSGVSHVFRVQVTSANPGQALFFIDDVQIGAAIGLGQSYYGGWLGAWKNLSTDVLNFTNISRVWRF